MKTTMADIYRIIGKINSEGGKARVEQAGSGGLNLYLDRINPFDDKIEKDHEYYLRGTKKDIYEALIKIRFVPQYRPYAVRGNPKGKKKLFRISYGTGPALNIRAGSIEEAERIFHKKAKSIRKKYGIHPNYRRGSRGSVMNKKTRWQLFGYDVWGNSNDGWEVNMVLPGKVITLTTRAEGEAKAFDTAMRRAGINLRWGLMDNSLSEEDTLYFTGANGKPLGELRRLK